MRFIFILFLNILLFSQNSFAANSYIFRKYAVDNGLSENTVRVIMQDRQGFMWFGTKDGLNRFDGISSKIYKRTPDDKMSMSTNFIISLYQDKNDNIWVDTDNGLYIYNYYTERFTFFDKKTKDGVSIKFPLMAICCDADGNMWLATDRQGLFIYNEKNDTLIQYTHDSPNPIPSNAVSCIFIDNKDTVWIGTREGFAKYNRKNRTFMSYGIGEYDNLKDIDIISIFQDSDGIMWFGSWSGGLMSLDKAGTFNAFFNSSQKPYISHIRKIFEYKKGQLMIGADDGLYLFDKTTLQCSRIDNLYDIHSLSDQNVYDIYKDREGGTWIGTYFGGVNYLPPNNEAITHIYPTPAPNSLSGKAVSQFCEDNSGNLWIATEDGGLNYFDTKNRTFDPITSIKKGISYHNLHALTLVDDKLWIGTFSRGIDVFDLKTQSFKNYKTKKDDKFTISDDCVFALYKTKNGRLYAGAPFGLCAYDKAKDVFERLNDLSTFVYDMTEDHLGQLWVASYFDGAYCYSPKTKKWKQYKHAANDSKSIGLNRVVKVYSDESQRLWFALQGGGISRYNYETDDFTTISSKDGLPNDVVYGILDDDAGNIWVSTNKGVSRIDPKTLKIETYTKSDGLQGDQFNYRSAYKSRAGLLYFGGLNGFSIINPYKLTENAYIPPVVITEVTVISEQGKFVNQPFSIDRKTKQRSVRLNYNTSLNIHFVSLSYIAPEKNSYSYQMRGIDDKWINIGTQRSVSYANLAPGEYQFTVRASNNNGVWNEEGDVLKIIILPPFWKTTIAYVFYIIIFIVLVVLIVKYLYARNRQRHIVALEEFRQEKERESFDTKINFFTNIAHEIRTPLSLIKAPLELILESQDGNTETKGNLSVIEKNTDRLLELINQLLDFRKIEKDSYHFRFSYIDVRKTIDDIVFRFRKAALQKNIVINQYMPEGSVSIVTDKEAFTKIMSNLLTNALKYTKDLIEIRLVLGDEHIEIKVVDNGIGIPDAAVGKIFEPFYQVESQDALSRKKGTGLGLALVKQLVEHLNGNITVLKTTVGASFLLTLPIEQREEHANNEQEDVVIFEEEADIYYQEDASDVKKKHLLVVEDNKDLNEFLKRSLTDYEVFVAENGKEAYAVLKKHNIDIIVSDVVMPEVDGLELTNMIKNDELYSHIPIILLSAKTTTDSKIHGLELGADFYIEKPFSITHLRAQIASILENRKRILEQFTKSPLTPFEIESDNKKDTVFLTKVNEIIEREISDIDFSIEKLASLLAVSRSNLQRKIKGISGMPPNDYIRVIKLKKAARLLVSGEYQVNEVCYLVGFNSASYFSKCFLKQFGMLPKDFLNRDKPEES